MDAVWLIDLRHMREKFLRRLTQFNKTQVLSPSYPNPKGGLIRKMLPCSSLNFSHFKTNVGNSVHVPLEVAKLKQLTKAELKV